jgi:hypothetical protein
MEPRPVLPQAGPSLGAGGQLSDVDERGVRAVLGRGGRLGGRHPEPLRNWGALAPGERWWPYTLTVATTGQAMQKGVGWRKALRAAIADNPS